MTDRGPRRHARRRSTKASPKCRPRSPISASSRCARRSRSSRPSGRSSPAISNISPGAGWSRPAISPASPAGTISRSGQAAGNHWGDAVTLLETTAAGPYYFNFHQGDLGNFTVIGPSGSGKTVVLNFLLAQARKFRPRIIFFDKDRGAELFIRAIGGRYDLLRPGTPSGLNPLQLDDNPANRQFLIDWLALLAGGADIDEIGADQGRDRRQFRPAGRASPAALPRRAVPRRAAAARAPICGRGSGPGGARASAPGCSTTRATRPTSTADIGRLRHDPDPRRSGDAHPGDDVSLPPRRGAARRHAPRSSSSTKAGRRSTTTSSCAGSRIGRRRSASATASSASPRKAPRTRSKAGSPARSSSRPRRRSSWPIRRRAPTITSRASG